MVRLKNRWMIVRIDRKQDAERNPSNPNKFGSPFLPSKRDIFNWLSDAVVENFGIVVSGSMRDSRGTIE